MTEEKKQMFEKVNKGCAEEKIAVSPDSEVKSIAEGNVVGGEGH